MSNYIDGQWLAGSAEPMTSFNPASGHLLWEGTAATSGEVDAAVVAAHAAFGGWSEAGVDRRIELLERFADAVTDDADIFAGLISREVGKPLWEAKTEVGSVAAKIGHSVRAYRQRTGVHVDEASGGITRHRPHGVMAVFGPYNFPAHLPNGHIVPALLAGNTVVFKPSELTPLVGEHLVHLWERSGLPAGVLNLVQGGRDTGAALAAAAIEGLLFTGSAATGALLHRQFGGRPEVLLALEMGGNNPLIVIEGAELQAAVAIIIQSAFVTTGQRCTCARRLFVPHGDYGDTLIAELLAAAQHIRIGDPQDEEEAPFMGPVISTEAAGKLFDAQDRMVASGAVPLLKMTPVQGLSDAFVTTGILDVTRADVDDEEHFGPLLTVTRYADLPNAVAGANATRFGLAAGVIGGDRETYDRLWSQLRAGIVNWNRPTTGASSAAPFGGVGASGNHRPAAFYAADYSSYPVASMESGELVMPPPMPGQ